MHGWRKIPQAAEYFGLSARTMRTLIRDHGFPVSRLPTGTQLVSLERGDDWLREFDVDRQDKHIVDNILSDLKL
jgi:hypothetical protein